jgi:hypothetical protein
MEYGSGSAASGAAYVGERAYEDAAAFMAELSERVTGRIQLTTNGHSAYANAVGLAFRHNIDFAQIIKQYASPREGQARYSPLSDHVWTMGEIAALLD